MTNFVPQIRVFLASPGDVNEERAVALQVLDMLEYDPLFRKDGAGGVSIHAIAWDKPGGDVPMRATKTPQTAIKEGLPKPSDCDIVLVLFWSRMGTPLPHPEYQRDDGSPYLSGTEWEFRDAINAEKKNGKPITLIYRRTEEPKFDRKDRKANEQYYKVLDFFDQFRDPDTGALLGGFNEYANPEDFRQKLVNHLRHELNKLLTGVVAPLPSDEVEAPPLWTGSPFPGLRPFTEKDAPIFFGRGLEVAQ
ncbi:MAG: SIR2 family protein, partial [Chloroflexota bacterium]